LPLPTSFAAPVKATRRDQASMRWSYSKPSARSGVPGRRVQIPTTRSHSSSGDIHMNTRAGTAALARRTRRRV